MSGLVVDTFNTYMFIKRLITPFKEWDAYKLGIINENGNRTKKKITTPQEKNAWGRFDILVRNIKMILNKIPGIKTRLGSIAAAMFLLKEGIDDPENLTLLEEKITEYMELLEDGGAAAVAGGGGVPANNAGGGQIAGIGVGPSGEPGMYPKKSKYTRKNAKEEGQQTADLRKVIKQMRG
jgi:hypothetical protein